MSTGEAGVGGPEARATGGRRRNRRGEGELLRAELIAAASRLLETLGSEEALSLRAVAREAGVSAPSVYLHFDDKDDLVRAVLVERFRELHEQLEAAAATGEGPADELRARCRAYCRFALTFPGNYRVLFGAVLSPKPGLTLDTLPGADVFLALLDNLRRCRDADVSRPVDPLLAAATLWTSLHGLVLLRASKPSFPWPSVEDMLSHLLVEQVGQPRVSLHAPADPETRDGDVRAAERDAPAPDRRVS